jgi:hypothetical protein
VDNQPWPIAYCASRRTVADMVAGHVEMVLFEQSIANADGVQRPFFDRVADAAEKTADLSCSMYASMATPTFRGWLRLDMA